MQDKPLFVSIDISVNAGSEVGVTTSINAFKPEATAKCGPVRSASRAWWWQLPEAVSL
jgi:hypothetical protein